MATKKEPKRRGRPAVKIDIEQLKKLGAMHATYEEVGAWFDCTKRTIITKMKNEALRFAFENGKLVGNLNLKRLSVRHAEGNGSSAVNMTIYLRKQWLGETDKAGIELTGRGGGPISTIDLTKATDEQLAALEAIFGPLAGSRKDDGGDQGGEGSSGAAA
jgi:hypothetical protein